MNSELVYYLPGRHEPLDSGPGKLLLEWGYRVGGRTIPGDLTGLGFDEQTALIRSDLMLRFQRRDALVVGRSYGAYLLLHALAGSLPFPGRVVVFSPVLGAALARREGAFYGAIPPRAGELEQLAKRGAFPVPKALDIYLGSGDAGCSVEFARELASRIGGRLHVIGRAGHELGAEALHDALCDALDGRRRRSE